ncbi:replication initiation protein [Flammeovirga sp. SJP92]|uniref:replication initiation protein n=1 Tax=Flammeovirga sp. SJP92 TaxID=1775430 RepID=UPI00078944B0|nr:replication initiation protein [Flammeovirga sp. SJP92]KXX66771.1 hypothetical protein AVL50_30020 [Flammeovirga sp. SJP92]
MDLINNITTRAELVKRPNQIIEANTQLPIPGLAQKLFIYTNTFHNEDYSKPITFKLSSFYGRYVGGQNLKDVDKACQLLKSSMIMFYTPIDKDSGLPVIIGKDGDVGLLNKGYRKEYVSIFDRIVLDKTKVTFEYSDNLLPYLNAKSNYTTYIYGNIRQMRSKYGPKLYDLLSRGIGFYESRKITVDDFRSVFGLEKHKTYQSYGRLKQSVITPSIKDINKNADIEVSLKEYKKGRTIKVLEFFFSGKVDHQQRENDFASSMELLNTEFSQDATLKNTFDNFIHLYRLNNNCYKDVEAKIIDPVMNEKILGKWLSEIITEHAGGSREKFIIGVQNNMLSYIMNGKTSLNIEATPATVESSIKETPAEGAFGNIEIVINQDELNQPAKQAPTSYKFEPVNIPCPEYGTDQELFKALSTKLAKKLNHFGTYDFSTKKFGEWHQVYLDELNNQLFVFYKDMKSLGIGNSVIRKAIEVFVNDLEEYQVMKPLKKEIRDLRNAVQRNEIFPNKGTFAKMINDW